MAKTFKPRFFLLTILLFMLLLSAMHSFMPAAHASEPTIQEKGVSILSNVAGIDMAKYNVTSKEAPPYQYFDVFYEDNMHYTLESHSSKIDVLCTFAKGKLHILHVLETEGSPSMTKQAPSITAMAKSFLNDYAGFSGSSLYSDLGLMLNGVEAGKNSTATLGNVKLQVNATADNVTFSWIYTFNGVDAAEKCVALGYKNGFVKYFVDTWSLYNIGSTTVNLSKDEAVAIAMQSIKTFSYKVGSGNETFEVKDFKVTRAMVTQLHFCSSIGAGKARGDDALMLYPMWRIGIGLDKFYPGNVYGIYVDIWADTKEVKAVQEVFSTLPPELVGSGLFDEDAVGTLDSQASGSEVQSNFAPSFWVALAVVSVVFGAAPFWLRLKKGSLRFHNFPVLRSSRITVGLLCFLLFSVSLLAPISIVTADNGRATIWGERTYNKTEPEQHYQNLTAANVTLFFGDAGGYSVTNYQVSDTVKSTILTQINYSEQNYYKAAVVYFDHGMPSNATADGSNWHYGVHDNEGTLVFDMDIYPETQGKTFFAFINTCMSANVTPGYGQGIYGSGKAFGLPYAFTHNLVGIDMSSDGYNNPWGDSCYIGFPWGSASLSQSVEEALPYRFYWMWVYAFFWFALHDDISINSALDQASLMIFNSDFGYTDLHTGFYPVWGQQWPYNDSFMVVYGNGNIKLYPPLLTLSGRDNNNNPCYPMFNIDGLEYDVGVGGYRLVPGVHEINVNDMTNYAFSHFSYKGSNYSRPANIEITDDSELIAHYTLVQQSLAISSSGSGYTYPTGTQWYDPFTSPLVQAYPDAGYENFWVLNSRYGGSGTSTYVYINGPQTLQAVFYPEQPHYFAAALCDYDLASNPGDLTGWENDDYFASIYGCGYYGWISAGMNKQASGHIYVRGCGYGPLYVYVSSDGEDWNYVSSPEVTSETPYWIDCGICQDQFSYIKLTAEGDVAYVEMDSVKVEPLVYYDLTISAGAHGTTNPAPGVYEDILGGTQYGVTAIADSGYFLDHWLLDSSPAGNQNPKYVTMDGNHTLQAVFDQNPNNPWLTVEAYDCYAFYEVYPDVYVDSGGVGAAPVSVQVTAASHYVEVDDMVWSDYLQCYVYFYYFYDDNYYYYYDNPVYLPVTSDMTLTAWYYG